MVEFIHTVISAAVRPNPTSALLGLVLVLGVFTALTVALVLAGRGERPATK